MNSPAAPRSQHRPLLLLQVPLIVLLLAFTAVPIDPRIPNRDFDWTVLYPRFVPFDVFTNVLGYMPVGALLATATMREMLSTASAISLFAEGMQVLSSDRSPSWVDVVANVLGAAVGWALGRRLSLRPRPLPISKPLAVIAAILAATYVTIGGTITPSAIENAAMAFVSAPPWTAVSENGASRSGTLEAHWTLDSIVDGTTPDSSDNRLTGVVVNGAPLVSAIVGQGLDLNGVTQAVDVGNPIALRLIGSMTISAWIKAVDYPNNDNTIVSNMNGADRGFQLDVTTDVGPPAIGFKLTDDSGRRMARYGATRLRRNEWYHVAGVYDAQAQTLNVFLNGRPDNGCLQGQVTTTQRISGADTSIGAGRDTTDPFTGIIDDVKIYSRALTPPELAAEVEGVGLPALAVPEATAGAGVCPSAQFPDGRVAGFVVGLGMLVAAACVGLWPSVTSRGPALVLSLLVGVVLLATMGSTVPPLLRWMVPLLTLAGGSSIVVSIDHLRSQAG